MTKTLAMLKMEKNFVAVIEKKYPRKPYEAYTLALLIECLKQEVNELEEAYIASKYEAAKLECADISNIVDYIFERIVSYGVDQ